MCVRVMTYNDNDVQLTSLIFQLHKTTYLISRNFKWRCETYTITVGTCEQWRFQDLILGGLRGPRRVRPLPWIR